MVIVIPARVEPDLRLTLESIYNADKPDRPFEIIIVFNHPEDENEELKKLNEELFIQCKDWIYERKLSNCHLIKVFDLNKKHAGDSKELQRIELETQRIELMISEMLNLSRIQLTHDKKETIALNEFLEDLLLDAKFEANEYGKIFTYPELTSTTINIYPELAYRAVENIIRNAIKYARQSISVNIAVTPSIIILTIKNDGELIPESELTNIFRPFYRLNESRDRETGGVGLGLSIAENAMLKHGGKIWAENIDKQVCMHLQFPRFS